MKNKLVALCGLLALCSAGCAGDRPIGTQTVVSRMPESKPDWTNKSSYEADGKLWFSGGVAGRFDMALGIREARAEAEKNLAESVRQSIYTRFAASAKGENADEALGRQVEDTLGKVSGFVEISGVVQRDQYVEKVEQSEPGGVRYTWNCFSLLSLAKADYYDARRRTLDRALAKARSERNAKAEAALNSVLSKLETEEASANAAAAKPAEPVAAAKP